MHWTTLFVSALALAPVLAAQTTPPSQAQQRRLADVRALLHVPRRHP